jgi:hypothetical protein
VHLRAQRSEFWPVGPAGLRILLEADSKSCFVLFFGTRTERKRSFLKKEAKPFDHGGCWVGVFWHRARNRSAAGRLGWPAVAIAIAVCNWYCPPDQLGQNDAACGRWQRKDFFFEKKKQKTFALWAAPLRRSTDQDLKVFWFFFSKKNGFLV